MSIDSKLKRFLNEDSTPNKESVRNIIKAYKMLYENAKQISNNTTTKESAQSAKVILQFLQNGDELYDAVADLAKATDLYKNFKGL